MCFWIWIPEITSSDGFGYFKIPTVSKLLQMYHKFFYTKIVVDDIVPNHVHQYPAYPSLGHKIFRWNDQNDSGHMTSGKLTARLKSRNALRKIFFGISKFFLSRQSLKNTAQVKVFHQIFLPISSGKQRRENIIFRY